MLFIYSYQA